MSNYKLNKYTPKYRWMREWIWYFGYYYKWTVSQLEQRSPFSLWDCQVRHYILYEEWDFLSSIEVDENSVSISTDLQDKEGKGIYNWDIIEYTWCLWNTEKWVIEWYFAWWWGVGNTENFLHEFFVRNDEEKSWKHLDLKVIWNIFENPELQW